MIGGEPFQASRRCIARLQWWSEDAMRRNDGSNLLWFLAGVTLGAAASVMFAPVRGAETRRFLGRKSRDARGFLQTSGREYFDKGRHLYEQGRMLADDAAEMFEEGRRLVERAEP
jgi:gas vesicle protein